MDLSIWNKVIETIAKLLEEGKITRDQVDQDFIQKVKESIENGTNFEP